MSNYIKLHKYITIYFGFVFIALYWLTVPAYAAETNRIDSLLKISPVLLKISLEPGSKQIHIITVENRTNNPMPIRAAVEGFDPSDEESGYSPKPATTATPLSSWITLSENESIIPAKSAKSFSVKISVPQTVPVGGYYAVIYFSPVYPTVSVSSKIGVIALANIGIQDAIEHKADITHFSFDTPLYEKNPLTAHIRVTNTALHYFSAKPRLTISPLWGKSDSVELDEKILLPGKSRTWKSVFSIQNSKWGIYKATLTVSLENGYSISKSTPVAILPIRLFIVVIIGVSIVLFIWRKRNNVARAFFVLVRGTEPVPMEAIPVTPSEQRHEAKSGTEEIRPSGRQSSRTLDPQTIIDTVRHYNGSISLAADALRIDRTTVYRWITRAKTSHANTLQRKSTKPHTTRKTRLSDTEIKQIVLLKKSQDMSAADIVKELKLPVSARTVFRILQSKRLTKTYKE